MGKVRNETITLETKDGRRIMAVVNATLVRVGGEVYAVSISDVSGRDAMPRAR